MKKIIFSALLAAALPALAQDAGTGTAPAPFTTAKKDPAAKVNIAPDLAAMTAQLKKKFDAGKTTEADLAENIKAIGDLIVKHQADGDREQLARLYLLDAHIYADGLTNLAKARAIWTQVTRDFPGTLAARGAGISLSKLNTQASMEPDPSIPEGLQVGQKFPGFSETALNGQTVSVTAERGKVTLIDFWATWCGPCKGEMPNVIATYNSNHAQGFDIIGVSLDSDRDELSSYIQAHQMTWPEFFDGNAWDNKLAKRYGIQSIPMNYLLNRHGIILGKELRGEALGDAVTKALAAN